MSIVPLPLPFQLANNTLADATQVLADLNYIANAINSNAGVAGTVKNSSASTLQSYLASILVAGSGIALATLNPGGAEQLSVSSTAAALTLAQIQAAAASI